MRGTEAAPARRRHRGSDIEIELLLVAPGLHLPIGPALGIWSLARGAVAGRQGTRTDSEAARIVWARIEAAPGQSMN